MQIRATIVVLLSCVSMLSGEVHAQTTSDKASDQTIPGDIIFEVPINLTRLSPSLTKLAVTCAFGRDPKSLTIYPNMGTTISGTDVFSKSSGTDVLSNRVEFPVSAGQVVTTARVVIAAPATPTHKPGAVLNYECALSALSSDPLAGSGWHQLGEKVPVTSLQLSPVPVPIKGTFTW